MEIDREMDVSEIIKLHKLKVQEKWEYYKKFQDMDNIIKDLEYEIYNKCKHEWELDYSASGPYDGPDRICKKCNLYKNNYIYTKR